MTTARRRDVTRSRYRPLKRLFRRFGYDVQRHQPGGVSVESHLSDLLPRMAIDCVIDVGGHWGEYGTLLRDAGYRGPIVSFEPASANIARLRSAAAQDDRWQVRQEALGREAGELVLN